VFLYFIQAGDAIKIGITNNISARMREVQVGNPFKVTLLYSIPFEEENARRAESTIHELFNKTNLSGEWFQANQFILDFIENIKEKGWESHSSWLEERYQSEYGEIANKLKKTIERGIIYGDLISLEELKSDLGKLLDSIKIPSLPVNLTQTVREWIEKREEPFTLNDIYYHFGIYTKKAKNNVHQMIFKFKEDGLIDQSGRATYFLYKK